MTESTPKAPKPPDRLSAAGRQLWAQVHEDVFEAGWGGLTQRERAILEAACVQSDLNVSLQQALEREGIVTIGAAGQKRLNAITTELRQGNIALARLIGELRIPDAEGEEPAYSKRELGRHAAQTRWQRRRGRVAAR